MRLKCPTPSPLQVLWSVPSRQHCSMQYLAAVLRTRLTFTSRFAAWTMLPSHMPASAEAWSFGLVLANSRIQSLLDVLHRYRTRTVLGFPVFSWDPLIILPPTSCLLFACIYSVECSDSLVLVEHVPASASRPCLLSRSLPRVLNFFVVRA